MAGDRFQRRHRLESLASCYETSGDVSSVAVASDIPAPPPAAPAAEAPAEVATGRRLPKRRQNSRPNNRHLWPTGRISV